MPSISLLLFTHESFDMNSTGTYVLGANEKHLSERVSSDISICTVPESKSFVYMWSTSYVKKTHFSYNETNIDNSILRINSYVSGLPNIALFTKVST